MFLRGHTFKTSTVGCPAGCYLMCEEELTCQSYNFVIGHKVCELNNRTKEARPEDFMPDPTRFYIKRSKNRGTLHLFVLNQFVSLLQCQPVYLAGFYPQALCFGGQILPTEAGNCEAKGRMVNSQAEFFFFFFSSWLEHSIGLVSGSISGTKQQAEAKSQEPRIHIFAGNQFNVHMNNMLGQQLRRELEQVIIVQKETGSSRRMVYSKMAKNVLYAY